MAARDPARWLTQRVSQEKKRVDRMGFKPFGPASTGKSRELLYHSRMLFFLLGAMALSSGLMLLHSHACNSAALGPWLH